MESLAARLADADPSALLRDLNGAVATPQARIPRAAVPPDMLVARRIPRLSRLWRHHVRLHAVGLLTALQEAAHCFARR